MAQQQSEPVTPTELLDLARDRLEHLAKERPQFAVPFVRLAGALSDAASYSTRCPTGPDTFEEALALSVVTAADAAMDVAEAAPSGSTSIPTAVKELLADLLELAVDPDHGEYSTSAIDDLRRRARTLLIGG